MNRIFLSLLAACRTRSSALGALVRLCVRGAFCSSVFPLARPLPSTASAAVAAGFVRRLRRYYGPVRLPATVHRRLAALGLPDAARGAIAAGDAGISRFSRREVPYVHGVSDRAGSLSGSRCRARACCLPPRLTASAPRTCLISRLNTRPARAPVNASPPPSRAPAHDSGSSWVASSFDVWLFHPLLSAGLSRRTVRSTITRLARAPRRSD